MSAGIYSIRNKINSKVYIGKSINLHRRELTHRHLLQKKDRSKKHTNRYLWSAVQKYGWENFEFVLLEIIEEPTEDLLKERELYWMDYYQSYISDKGYNLRRDSSSRMIVHEDTKQLLASLYTGQGNPNYNNRWSEEQKSHLSQVRKEMFKIGTLKITQEQKDKWSITSSNTWKDEEKKKQMSLKVKEAKRKFIFEQYSKDEILINTWDSVEEIIERNPEYKWQNIYAASNGNKKSYKGFIWKKVLRDIT